METRKLYYEDCHTRIFSACVEECTQTPAGWEVVLDQTAFYPEGGGQACDLGTLDDAKVTDVRERGERIVHLCDKPLEQGRAVTGTIDWVRRFDLMQQHTGEHIVSGLVHAAYGYHNVGFHMGNDLVTIDFDGPISREALADIERKANEAVWADLPVRCWYPSEAELPAVGYRTKKQLPWPVRIVEVPGYDKCACCGVHTARTGEVGVIKLLSCVKFHQGVRIEMICGARALVYLSGICEQNRQVSQIFSAKPLETGEAARKFSQQLADEKFRAAGLEKQLFDAIAAGCVGQKDVIRFETSLAPAGTRELADRIARVCEGVAAVFSGTDETGYTVCMVSRQEDLKALGAAMSKALNGRGGGKPGFFQGSLRAARTDIEAFFAGYRQNGE